MGICKKKGCLQGVYHDAVCFQCYLARSRSEEMVVRVGQILTNPVFVFLSAVLIFLGVLFWIYV